MQPLTEPQRLMLEVLRDLNDERSLPGGEPRSASPRDCAQRRWPDSPGWNKVSRRGSTAAGGALGATMPMKAATVLHRLADRGLARRVGARYDPLANLWQILPAGRRWLDEYAAQQGS